MSDTFSRQQRGPIFWGWLLMCLLSVVIVHVFQSRARDHHRERHAELRQELEQIHTESQTALRQELKENDQTRLEKQKATWLQAVGGVVEWAAKNPEYDIQTMLEQVARASSPAGSVVSTRVDRFTEYSLTVELPSGVSTNLVLRVARDVLRHGKTFLSQVTFVKASTLIAEITPAEMDRIKGTQRISDAELAGLLWNRGSDGVASGSNPQPVAVRSQKSASPPPDIEKEIAEQLRAALHQAFALFDSIRDLLNGAIRDHRELSQVEGLDALPAFRRRYSRLSDVAQSIRQARARLGVAAGEYRLVLEQRGFSPSVAQRSAERLSARLSPLESRLVVALKALEDQNGAVSSYLKELERHLGDWGALPASSAYQTAVQSLQRATLAVSEAVSDYNRFEAPTDP